MKYYLLKPLTLLGLVKTDKQDLIDLLVKAAKADSGCCGRCTY